MKQLMMILALLISFPAASLPAKANSCSYCGKIEALRRDTKSVKPDALDAKTIRRQLDLLDQGINLILLVLREKPALPEADLARIVEVMSLVNPYDYQYLMGERFLEKATKSQVERVFEEIDRQEKSKALSAQAADELRIALGTAEDSAERGTDPDAPGADEVLPPVPARKPQR